MLRLSGVSRSASAGPHPVESASAINAVFDTSKCLLSSRPARMDELFKRLQTNNSHVPRSQSVYEELHRTADEFHVVVVG